MREFAVVDYGKIVGFMVMAEPPALEGKPYRQFLPVEYSDPPFDPAKQRREAIEPVIDGDIVKRGWVVTDMTAEEIAAQVAERHDAALAPVDEGDNALRALVLMLIDELNLHSERLAEVLQAAAGATSLAAFRTAMGAIKPIPRRTPEQVRAALKAKLSA